MSEQHRLIGAGLPNVYLVNGYTVTGEGADREICIRNVEGLYAATAEAICMSPSTLTPAELRFLRKRLELSQEALGTHLGKTSQAVAKWEKSETAIPMADSVLIKMLWLQRCRPHMNVAQAPLDASAPPKDRYVFEVSAFNTWSEQQQQPGPMMRRLYRSAIRGGTPLSISDEARGLVTPHTTVHEERTVVQEFVQRKRA